MMIQHYTRICSSSCRLIVTDALNEGYTPKTLPFVKARQLYAQAAEKYQWKETNLPLQEAEFRNALSPTNMVKTRVGTGGPQPAEVQRMLGEAKQALQADVDWTKARRQRLAEADTALDQAFGKLLKN